MPKLRNLTGSEVVAILEAFGFTVIRIKGSHHIMRRFVDGKKQTLNIPVHSKKPLPTGTLRSIYRDACHYIPEEEVKVSFYAE